MIGRPTSAQATNLAALAPDPRQFLAEFELPRHLEATGPIEATGLARDSVRLQVASNTGGVLDMAFEEIALNFGPGDVLVVNDSGTLPAAVLGRLAGETIFVHVAVPAQGRPHEYRAIELRTPTGISSVPFDRVSPGDIIELPEGGTATIIDPFTPGQKRLWLARLALPEALVAYLYRHGQPIRYSYAAQRWPLASYQTIFAREPGSSEMPSAGRPFTAATLATLAERGVSIEALTLHTGVASLESHEPPYPEPYNVPWRTARRVNAARLSGNRVVAVGTTVVRALQTVCDDAGVVNSGSGFTDLVIEPGDIVRSVDGILTGWHEPKATHLHMLEAIAGGELLANSYADALVKGYKWHEFGDMQLILRN